jgi:hypothetical protein
MPTTWFACLAREAEFVDGVLNITGAFAHTFSPVAFPAEVPVFGVVQIYFDAAERGQAHKIEVDPEPREGAPSEIRYDASVTDLVPWQLPIRGDGTIAPADCRLKLVIHAQQPGRYHFVIRVDDRVIVRLPFEIGEAVNPTLNNDQLRRLTDPE